MKVIRKLSETTTVEAEGDTVAEVFEELSRLEAVFSVEVCGLCQCDQIRHDTQSDKDGNKYHKAVCRGCGAEFRFGIRREPAGVLFPQLKDKEGNWKPNGGWAKWAPHAEEETQPAPTIELPSVLLGKALAILTPASKKGVKVLQMVWETLSPEMKRAARQDISDLIEEARKNQ